LAVLSYREAARQAIAEEMRRDPTVWALGEDLGRGGVWGQYGGLVDEFGPRRIADTPISESTIMGAAVGAALVGTRPVVEMRFSDFALIAVDELVNQAAKMRYMFGGQARVPLVARLPIGLHGASAAQHSQSLEAWWVHMPGLVVVTPATPADNKGLLKAAIRSSTWSTSRCGRAKARSPTTITSCRLAWRGAVAKVAISRSSAGRGWFTSPIRRRMSSPLRGSAPRSLICARCGRGTRTWCANR
jgi:transketolase C-terminal domain/subunit